MDLDYRLFQMVNGIAGHYVGLDTLARNFATYGALVFPAALVYLCRPSGRGKRPDYRTAFSAAASAGLALLMAHLIGYAYFRPRPFAEHQVNLLLGRSPDPSFPSDHTTFVFALLPALWFRSRRAGWLLLAAGVVLAASRVFCGTHYPGDVAGGALLGLLASCPFLRLRDPGTSVEGDKKQATE